MIFFKVNIQIQQQFQSLQFSTKDLKDIESRVMKVIGDYDKVSAAKVSWIFTFSETLLLFKDDQKSKLKRTLNPWLSSLSLVDVELALHPGSRVGLARSRWSHHGHGRWVWFWNSWQWGRKARQTGRHHQIHLREGRRERIDWGFLWVKKINKSPSRSMNKLHNELKKLSFVVSRRSSLLVVGGFIYVTRAEWELFMLQQCWRIR